VKRWLSQHVVIHQYGLPEFHTSGSKVTPAEREEALRALAAARECLRDDGVDILILDEANVAMHFGVVRVSEVLGILNQRRPGMEVVITGRYAPREILDRADLVTEMKEIRHYYRRGVEARDGIER